MGLCGSNQARDDQELTDSSYSWEEHSDGDIVAEHVAQPENDKPIYVKRRAPGVPNSAGVGISGLVFTSDNALSLAKPLFTSASSHSKSSSTLFRRATTMYYVPVAEVTSQLFFGSFEDAKDDENLRELGITHIISLIGPKHAVKGMKLKHRPMDDYGRTDLNRVIKKLWSFVVESQNPGKKLFVHCQSGQNRSATVVIAILMKLKSDPKKLDEAYRMVKRKRPVVQINVKYAEQLAQMECALYGQRSVPKNWMKIRSYDMETGSVRFQGEGLTHRKTTRKQQNLGKLENFPKKESRDEAQKEDRILHSADSQELTNSHSNRSSPKCNRSSPRKLPYNALAKQIIHGSHNSKSSQGQPRSSGKQSTLGISAANNLATSIKRRSVGDQGVILD